MTNKNDNSNSKYRNFYVLGDSLSDNGAIIGILNNLSFAKSVKFDDLFYQGGSFSNGPTDANSGLRKEESIGNRRLCGFDGIGNESRKDMNQKINRGSMASVFNF